MGLKDGRGLQTSCSSKEALQLFEVAFSQLLRYERDPLATTTACLELDSQFILGFCFRAYLNMFSMDPFRQEKARADLKSAQALLARAAPREALHVKALELWLEGDWYDASEVWDSILLSWPRDLIALKAGYLSDYYLGRSERMRDRIAASLPKFSPDEPFYGYLLGMLAYGFEECGDYERAEELGRRAVALNPEDVWAVHAVAHVFEMRGRFHEGIQWMHENQQRWAQSGSFFAVHNWWHLALFHMELDQYDCVLDIYDGSIRGEESTLTMDLEDAASMLWRCHLFSVEVGERWSELLKFWSSRAEDALYNFNDVHAMMVFAGAGERVLPLTLLASMEARSRQQTANAKVARRVGLPICRALWAFHQGDFQAAVAQLYPIRYEFKCIGGSHAQRDVLALSLIEAALRDAQFELARSLLAERIACKPEAPVNWLLLVRALKGLGDETGIKGAQGRIAHLLSSAHIP